MPKAVIRNIVTSGIIFHSQSCLPILKGMVVARVQRYTTVQ